MTAAERQGHEEIARAVRACGGPTIVVEMTRQFGDVLHSTLIVRHLRKVHPDLKIVWAIGSQYVEAFEAFEDVDQIAALPTLPPFPLDGPSRVRWVTSARELPSVVRAFGCGVHPWGWREGTLVDAVLLNADIRHLSVERRPWLPVTREDNAKARRFIDAHGLFRGFITLEYRSYSLGAQDMAWYAELVTRTHLPVVALGGVVDPELPGAVDGRGLSYRVAKALIARSNCFLGCGSGLSVLAASNGCEQPIVEMVADQLSLPRLGYRPDDGRYRNCRGMSPAAVASMARQVGTPT